MQEHATAGLPVQCVKSVRLVVVSSLVVPHVDRDGRMERREDVMGACRKREV